MAAANAGRYEHADFIPLKNNRPSLREDYGTAAFQQHDQTVSVVKVWYFYWRRGGLFWPITWRETLPGRNWGGLGSAHVLNNELFVVTFLCRFTGPHSDRNVGQFCGGRKPRRGHLVYAVSPRQRRPLRAQVAGGASR